MRTQPRFKDTCTPEEIAKDKEERDQKFEEVREQAKAREAERQATKEQKREAKIQKNELKLQKNQLKIQKYQLKNRNKIKCPKCRSTNVQPLGVHKKVFRLEKPSLGQLLLVDLKSVPWPVLLAKDQRKQTLYV